MSARLTFVGLEQLRKDLANLPAHLAQEAAGVIDAAADSAFSEILAGYERHRRTGELASGLKKKVVVDNVSIAARVYNTTWYANIFEHGTQGQRRQTDKGADRGPAPPGNVFIPVMARTRRRMYERLKEVVRKQGLEVSGDA